MMFKYKIIFRNIIIEIYQKVELKIETMFKFQII